MQETSRHRTWAFLALVATVLAGALSVIGAQPAQAGVYFNADPVYTYKEYWANHSTFTAGCGTNATTGGSFYVEPENCTKSVDLAIPDDIDGAIAAVIYVDLWRNRDTQSARFTVNDGPQFRPTVGSNFSRTPFTATVPLTQLQQGTNVLKFQEATGPYHVHDVMVRVYYDATNPIVPPPGGDVDAPTGALTGVRTPGGATINPATGGTLQVDGNQVVLSATASGAAFVEFHAYYEGFDEDNNGVTRDWHNFLRNNFGPGGTEAKSTGATIGHIATDSTAPYEVTWNLPDVVNQSGVRFKIRVVDANGNAREAAGGQSAEFTLARSYSVETYRITNFADQPLWFNNSFPQVVSQNIELPTDLGVMRRALMVGNYWNSPDISLNDNPTFPAFVGSEDQWATSRRELDPLQLRPGTNTIRWNYQPSGFGAMVEDPGPMIVIHRDPPAGAPVVTLQPKPAFVSPGQAATFSVAATGAPTLAYQWLRNGQPIIGATSATYVTPALTASENGASYSARVTNGLGNVVSTAAIVHVSPGTVVAGPWWNAGWDFRAPLTVAGDSVVRTNKVVEQKINFSELMTGAGAGGPSFDPNSIRVVEVNASGVVTDASVPFQFDKDSKYSASSNALGTLLWQLEGTTAVGASRTYHVYFDKAYKAIPAAVFPAQLTMSTTTDAGFPAYKFDLADGSDWYFHYKDGGGFSSVVDSSGVDWLQWSPTAGSFGDFRGFPNAVKPPAGWFHPGRPNKTTTVVLNEGPLKITFQTTSSDGKWVSVWGMYPTYSELTMAKADGLFWVLYEGVPGGEIDAADFIRRSDGVQMPLTGTFEADLPGKEWMYAADPTDNRSFYMAHNQDDGAVESYKLQDNAMTVLGFGRGGNSLNFPYLEKLIGGQPQKFTAGLANSTDAPTTGATIEASYVAPKITLGAATFVGVNDGPVSDAFGGATLDTDLWTLVDPRGDTAVTSTGSSLRLAIPAGAHHDLWTGRNTAPRLLQDVGDGDIDVSVGFNSEPTLQGQSQGMLFVQDANNSLRVSVGRSATSSFVAVYRINNGTATQLYKKTLTGVSQRYLRTVRTGDRWQFYRSWDGEQWFAAGAFTIPFDLTQLGVVATTYKSGTSPAFVADVDYFESASSTEIIKTGPVISNVAVDASARRAIVSWTTDLASTTAVDHGATIDLGESANDPALTTTHSIEVDFLRCGAPYFVQPKSTSDLGTTIAPVVTFNTDACPSVVSDDFSSGSIGALWRVVDPVGDATVGSTATNALVSLPVGVEHNLFTGENQATRLRQQGPIGDFSVQAKFESVVNKRFQMQGIVVEEDDDSFLRFEVHHDGSATKWYVASVLDGVAANVATGTLPTSPEHHIRVTRAGNTWSMWHSVDGVQFGNAPVASFNAGLDSVYVGPYIGNTSTGSAVPPAFIGSIDYFFNTASPITPEDGGATPDVTPPAISAIAVSPGVPGNQSTTVTWTTDELATTRIDWGLTTALTGGSIVVNGVTTSHSAVMQPLNCGRNYRYRVTSIDAAGNSGSSAILAFNTPACPSGPFSDNFDNAALDSRWFVRDPKGDGTLVPYNGLLSMHLPAGVNHDLSGNNNNAFRLLQAVPNGDFQVKVGFESVVDFNTQVQGLVFELDDKNLLRFDLSSDGTNTYAYFGSLVNNVTLSQFAKVPVSGSAPGTLHVTRTGTNWRFEYSGDRGSTWTTIWEQAITYTVARMGPFVGNAVTLPEFNGLIDYFWSSSDPIVITEPGALEPPQFAIFGGDGATWDGQPLTFGTPGLTQPDVNVRGRVTDSDGIASLTYSVNGGAPVAMGVGTSDCFTGVSCTRRLANNGDFNADVNSASLNPGANTVTIRAVDTQFNAATIDVPINYTPGTTWPLPYSVDWSGVTDLYDVAQPIDGVWSVSGDSLEIDEIGYDRLIAVGDSTWSSFEAEVPITINSFDPEGYAEPSGGPGIGFIPHWKGHTQEGIAQPKWGFSGRLGALVWYRYRADVNAERFEIRDSNAALVAEDLSGKKLTPGVTYIFKMQADAPGGGAGPTYRLKVWPQGSAEPSAWDIVTALPPTAPSQGSLALVAHHVDATFGDLQVRGLSASPPDVTPASGSYTGLTKVKMSSATPGGVIRYTLDGSDPTAASPIYVEPFFVNSNTVVRARTFRSGVLTSGLAERNYQISAAPARVTTGLQALYRFNEGSGTTVTDTSGVGTPANLTIQSGSNVTWLPGTNAALRVNGSSVIRSAGGVNKINDAIKSSSSMTMEMWIDPASLSPVDATMLNLAVATGVAGQQNLALNQSTLSLNMAMRTSTTNADGVPIQSAAGVLPGELYHLTYVRRPDRKVEVYVDGVKVWDSTKSGTLGTWVSTYALSLANSVQGTDPWIGDLHLVAIYGDDLTAAQVLQNFRAGPSDAAVNAAPVVNAGPDVVVLAGSPATMAATSSDDGKPLVPGVLTRSWVQISGPATATIANASSPTTTVTPPVAGTYVLEWRANDGEKSAADQVQITAIPASGAAAPPTVDPASGTYAGSTLVTMSSFVPGAQIRYTTDGTDPTVSSALYSAPVSVTATSTVKAVTFAPGFTPSAVVARNYTITAGARVSDGLVALYPFNEASGSTVGDTSGSAPLNLTIADVAKVTRVPSGVRINQPTLIQTTTGASKISAAAIASDEVSLEMWIEPTNITQTNAMIFGLSANQNARNLGLIGSGPDLASFLRTQGTSLTGSPATNAPGALAVQKMHVVFTRSNTGVTKVYVNGVEVASGATTGTLDNWVDTHRVHLGGERDGSKPWLGTYYLVAFYGRALTAGEVAQNYAVGDV